MKTLFKIILLSLFIVITLNAGESSTGKLFPDYNGGATWIDDVSNIINGEIIDLMQKIFNNVSNMLHSKVVYTILGCALMLWCLNQLKNGYPTREEMWKVGKWLVMACLILAIFSNYSVFNVFLEYIMIPASWIVSSLEGIFATDGKTMPQMTIQLFNDAARVGVVTTAKTFQHINSIWFKGVPDLISTLPSYILTPIVAFPMLLLALLTIILGLFFIAIIIITKFTATLLLCFSPIIIPLLALPFTKHIFYAWLKTFLTYTMIAPVAMLVLSLGSKQISAIAQLSDDKIGEWVANQSLWHHGIKGIVISIVSLYLLRKIPQWITQILGVQGADISQGLGKGASTASAIGGATMAGATAKALGTGSFGSTFMRALPGATTAGALGGQAMKGLGSLGGKVGAGMQSLGQTISGGNGIMASAGKTLGAMGSTTRDFSRSMRRGGENFKSTILNQ